MSGFYLDYYWSQGVPKGLHSLDKAEAVCFKVITDPYRKRFTVEKYSGPQFHSVVYDSFLFDFRMLKKKEEMEAWTRESVSETRECQRNLIRNMEERILLVEEIGFIGQHCHSCRLLSPHGIWTGTQMISKKEEGHPFNGVTLYDTLNRPVLIKKYEVDSLSGEFTQLLEEEWDHAPC